MSASEPQRNRVARGLVTVLVAVVTRLLPTPAGIELKAWHLFAILFATIIGLVLQPLPMGPMVFIGSTTAVLTDTLSIGDALNGFMNGTVWLIVVAFLFARALSKTGLGRRIAYFFIRAFGHSKGRGEVPATPHSRGSYCEE
jgi:DASS family divalent anion:Na+ symporter